MTQRDAPTDSLESRIADVRTRLRFVNGVLGEVSARQVLAPLDIPFCAQGVVRSADEAVAVSLNLDGPGGVVLKAVSDRIVHKSDAGLVMLGITGLAAVRDAYQSLAQRCANAGIPDAPIAVQPMAPPGIDLIVGLDHDDTFGPVIVVGFGGTNVELDRDVVRRCTPIDADSAVDMVRTLRQFPLLAGWRGRPRVDLRRFGSLVAHISLLADAVPALRELDLNPVRLFPNGDVLVLDARLACDTSRIEATPDASLARRPSLAPLFDPSSIAVVGASRDSTRPGSRLLANLQRYGYPGPIYPVNPSSAEIAGLAAFASVGDLPQVPDLVCVAIAAEATIDTVVDAVAMGVPAIIALASGFAEVGALGSVLEGRLADALSPSTALCGPNTIGIVSARQRVAATFTQALDGPELLVGNVAFITQSGAIGGSLLARELMAGYGISHWVTVGNETQLAVSDYLEHLLDDDDVNAIAIFLEGVRDGDRFRSALQRAHDLDVAVVAFKTGTSTAGARAVASHSAMLAGAPEVYASVLADAGAVQVTEMTALLEVAHVLAGPRPTSNGVGIVTTSGGAGSATADLVATHGLALPGFSAATEAALAAALPRLARPANPLDVTAEGAFAPGAIEKSVRIVASDPSVGAVCVVLTSLVGADATRVGGEIARAAAGSAVPILVTWLIDSSLAATGHALLASSCIRVFDEPARMVRALGHAVWRHHDRLRSPTRCSGSGGDPGGLHADGGKGEQ